MHDEDREYGDEYEEEEREVAEEYREIEIREQDRFLPIANIARIMKKVLPTNAKIAKEAKESIQECVSEFISFITSEASEKCQQEKRKTINGDDILWAMSTLGFDKYVDPLKIYLCKYRDTVKKGEKADKKQPAALMNKKSELMAPHKKMVSEGPQTLGYSSRIPSHYHQQSFAQSSHAPPLRGIGSLQIPYSAYSSSSPASHNSMPQSNMSFLGEHSAPIIAPGKGEGGRVSLPPPPPMTLQPPMTLASVPSMPSAYKQHHQQQLHSGAPPSYLSFTSTLQTAAPPQGGSKVVKIESQQNP